MKKNDAQMKPAINKNDFIDFLASATPEEVNKYIMEKGKPKKIIWPIFFYQREDNPQKMK